MECLHTNSNFDIFSLDFSAARKDAKFSWKYTKYFCDFWQIWLQCRRKNSNVMYDKYNIHLIFHVNEYRTYMVIMYPFVLQGNQANNIRVDFTR